MSTSTQHTTMDVLRARQWTSSTSVHLISQIAKRSHLKREVLNTTRMSGFEPPFPASPPIRQAEAARFEVIGCLTGSPHTDPSVPTTSSFYSLTKQLKLLKHSSGNDQLLLSHLHAFTKLELSQQSDLHKLSISHQVMACHFTMQFILRHTLYIHLVQVTACHFIWEYFMLKKSAHAVSQMHSNLEATIKQWHKRFTIGSILIFQVSSTKSFH